MTDRKREAWIHIDGPKIKNNMPDITLLAIIYQNIQRAFDNIGYSKYGKDYNKEECRLYPIKRTEGSYLEAIAPREYTPRLDGSPDPYLEITDAYTRLITCLNTKPDLFQEQLENEIESPESRISFLENIRSISKSGADVEVTRGEYNKEMKYPITGKNTSEIEKLIDTNKNIGCRSLSGILIGFMGYKPNYYFSMITEDKKTVKCYYNIEDEEKTKSLYKKWITVEGTIYRGSKSLSVQNVTSFSEKKTIKLNRIGKYSLLNPIELALSYDTEDDLWVMTSEKLALYGCGTDYNDAIVSLEGEIEGHAISFTEYPDEKHSDESLELKKRLQEHIDFTEVMKVLNYDCGLKDEVEICQ